MKKTIAAGVCALLILTGLWQFLTFFPDLPARVVTQQTASGEPSLVIAKAFLGAIYTVILLGGGAYFLGVGHLLHKLPERAFNILPGRDHWLAPERKAETVRSISTHFIWLGNATLIMFVGTFQAIFMVNTGRADLNLDLITNFLTTGYLTYIFIALLLFRNRFRTDKLPKGDAP